jgi:nitroreductase
MNDTQRTILGRRTVHKYTGAPLPEGALERALECALRAPNHKLTNPWRFTRLGPQARAAVTELGVSLKAAKAGDRWSPRREGLVRAKLSDPAELVVVSQVIVPDPFVRREDYAAVACAIQNASLSLWSEGVGSKWSSGGVTSHARTYALCGIDPEAEEIVGFLWMGVAEVVPDPVRDPLDEVFRVIP